MVKGPLCSENHPLKLPTPSKSMAAPPSGKAGVPNEIGSINVPQNATPLVTLPPP
jgi:hypothetical protein